MYGLEIVSWGKLTRFPDISDVCPLDDEPVVRPGLEIVSWGKLTRFPDISDVCPSDDEPRVRPGRKVSEAAVEEGVEGCAEVQR